MFIWRVKGSVLKYDIWLERKKPTGERNVEKAFPLKDSHQDFDILVATNAPLTIELQHPIRKRFIPKVSDAFEFQLEIKSVEQLGYCDELELQPKETGIGDS